MMPDLYFNPNYAMLYRDIDGESRTFTLDCEYGRIIHTFILRPVSLEGETYFDIVTPYGYGGPLILETTDTEKLMAQFQKEFAVYCAENHIICEFVRFHLFDNTDVREHFCGVTEHVLDNVVVDTSGTYNEIRMHYEHKVRKNVNKAIENGLVLVTEAGTSRLDDFLNIYYQTMDRNRASAYYYFRRDYFENIQKLLPDNFVYFYVLKDEQVVSAELVLCSERYAYSFLGGTDERFYSMRPNDFLKDGIIRWCNETGRKKFILGGGYHKDDGIYRYKRSFTKDPDVPFYVGKAIYNQDVYDKLVARQKAESPDFDSTSAYFPLYRA